MNIDIRKSVIDNFKNTDSSEIKNTIENSLKEKDEITLPGMGVFFEILWSNSDDKFKEEILHTISHNL